MDTNLLFGEVVVDDSFMYLTHMGGEPGQPLPIKHISYKLSIVMLPLCHTSRNSLICSHLNYIVFVK